MSDFEAKVLAALDELKADVKRIDARMQSVESVSNEVNVAVAALTVGQGESRDTLGVIESHLKHIDARLDRIERHTGLVKA